MDGHEPYNLEEAQEEAAKMRDLVGKKGSKEDYDVAKILVEEKAKDDSGIIDETAEEDNLEKHKEVDESEKYLTFALLEGKAFQNRELAGSADEYQRIMFSTAAEIARRLPQNQFVDNTIKTYDWIRDVYGGVPHSETLEGEAIDWLIAVGATHPEKRLTPPAGMMQISIDLFILGYHQSWRWFWLKIF